MGHGRHHAPNEGSNLSLNCLLIYYDEVGSDEARRFYSTQYCRELPDQIPACLLPFSKLRG